MNKWIAIPVIAVLAVGIMAGGYFLWQQTDKLGEAESEIFALEGSVSTLEGDVSTLEGNVSTLEGDVSTLETDLAESETTVLTLEADLGTANSGITNLQADVSTQRTINLALSEELKTVKDPRHFSSLTELVDWLEQDDTDTKYADKSNAEKAFILQVRALRDGYLLPTIIVNEEGGATNLAILENEYWIINPEDDDTEFFDYVAPIPSHPLPLQ